MIVGTDASVNESRMARVPPDPPAMFFLRRFDVPALLVHPTNVSLLYLTFFLPTSPSLPTFASKMMDEPIYYLFSSRVPCLDESQFHLLFYSTRADLLLGRT